MPVVHSSELFELDCRESCEVLYNFVDVFRWSGSVLVIDVADDGPAQHQEDNYGGQSEAAEVDKDDHVQCELGDFVSVAVGAEVVLVAVAEDNPAPNAHQDVSCL